MTPDAHAAVTEAFREEWGRVVAALIGMTGDWDLAEECAQDAFARALEAVATRRRAAQTRRLADHGRAQPRHRPAAPRRSRGRQAPGGSGAAPAGNRRAGTGTTRHRRRPAPADVHLLPPGAAAGGAGGPHPAHPGGLTTAEIARAFLVARGRRWPSGWSGPRQRSATRASLTGCHRRSCCPSARRACWRCCTCSYNEGYAATAGADLVRQGLCAEAIRLARVLVELMPDEPEALALLALMLFQRRPPGQPGRRRGRPGAPRGPGPHAWDRARDRRGRPGCSKRRCGAASPAHTSCRRRSLAAMPTAAGCRRHGLGADRPRSTGSWRGWCPRRWWS